MILPAVVIKVCCSFANLIANMSLRLGSCFAFVVVVVLVVVVDGYGSQGFHVAKEFHGIPNEIITRTSFSAPVASLR